MTKRKMPVIENKLVIGLVHIAKVLHWSKTSLLKRRKELVEAGVIFYMYHGSPPQRRACAWTADIMLWTHVKFEKGEKL